MTRFMKVFFLLLLVCLFQQGYTQITVKGVVKSNRSKTLYGVSISLKDTYDGATTDSSGYFSFKTMEKGEQLLVASSVGHKPYEQKIKLEGVVVSLTLILKEEIT